MDPVAWPREKSTRLPRTLARLARQDFKKEPPDNLAIILRPQYPIIPYFLWQFNSGAFVGSCVPCSTHNISDLSVYHSTSTNMLALHTHSKSVNTLSKSGKQLSCDFTIVIKEWETTSFHHYVPSNHFLCGSGSIVQHMPRSCSLSSDRDRMLGSDRNSMLLQPQGYGQQSFVKSIGGEEAPSASDCINVFHAVLSGETNEHRCMLDSCVSHVVSSRETNECQCMFLLPCPTLHMMTHRYSAMAHLTQHKHCISHHLMQHEHHISRYSIATYPLWLDFMHLSLRPSHSSSDSPEIPLPLV